MAIKSFLRWLANWRTKLFDSTHQRGPEVEPFVDPEFGVFTWNNQYKWWSTNFSAGDLKMRVNLMLEVEDNEFAELWNTTIRPRLQWLRQNEPTLRLRVAEKMFSWWVQGWRDPEIDEVDSVEGFANTIMTQGVNIHEDALLEVHFEDGNLLGGHGIYCSVGDNGEIVEDPTFWG